MSTLHVRCGDDLREKLPQAGWEGGYFAFVDPLWHGPAWDDGDLMGFVSRRARFVAAEYGGDVGEIRVRLGAEYAGLRALPRHERVVLWFEHDLHDQILLARVLAACTGMEGRLFAVPADGVRHFGAMDVRDLAMLRGAEVAVTAAQIEAGAAVWEAVSRFDDPQGIEALRQQPLPWPHMAAALTRLLQELPWGGDGLALSERVALRGIAGGAADLSALMRAAHEADPVLHITDLALRATVRRLSDGALKLVSGTEGSWRVNERGAAVLAGHERHRTPPRWVGGTAVRSPSSWLWNEAGDLPHGGGPGTSGSLGHAGSRDEASVPRARP